MSAEKGPIAADDVTAKSIVSEKLSFYNERFPRIQFVHAKGGGQWHEDYTTVLTLLGKEATSLDYEHPEEFRQDLVDVNLHRIKVMEMEQRLVSIPDEGKALQLGHSVLVAIPAHYLHSEGNFQFYDPTSRILFSGDLAASFGKSEDVSTPVSDFATHIPDMVDFHRRFMGSNKILRLWVNMVREIDIEWIVPQHGRPFKGKKSIGELLDWLENLECGIDLVTQDNYMLPKRPSEWK